MTFLVQHLRSGEYAKRPQPLDLAEGQLAINYNNDSVGLFFRTDSGELIKAGPAYVGTAAPPQINYTERSIGEMWLDTSGTTPTLKVYTSSGWVATNGAAGSVTTASIEDGAVTTAKLAADSVTTDKIVNGAVTAAKIASGAVGVSKFSYDATILPAADNTYDLGSSLYRVANFYANNVYTGDLHMKNEKGDWTLIEESEFIKIRNNKTGAEFRIVMEAI
jgi:hypothetical protein